MCLRWITSFWRYHGCSKYMFRIAEEYTKTIKTNGRKMFFHLGENWFSKFQKFQKSKMWGQNLKNRNFQKSNISKLCWYFRFLKIPIFQIFYRNFENLKIQFRQDEKRFFVRIFLFVLVYSSAILNMYLKHPWYLQNDVIQRKHIVFF